MTLKNIFVAAVLLLSFTSCSYLKEKEQKSNEPAVIDREKDAQMYIENLAAMQYLEQAAVIQDTAYIAVPSRCGEAHYQDNMAKTFLYDMHRGGFTNIYCCKVINISQEHIWSDSLISGNVIGYADTTMLKKRR